MTNLQYDKILLRNNWRLFKSFPDRYRSPDDFDFNEQQPITAVVPGTVAMAVNGNQPTCWNPEYNYDEYDWWYLFDFDDLKLSNNSIYTENTSICFDGLSSLCEIWLNQTKLGSTDNMFRGYEFEISGLKNTDKLFLVFRSLTSNLKQKRPRPRWKTKLVDNQQMRWIRSTVLGHSGFWTPPIRAIGPWKNIYLKSNTESSISKLKLLPTIEHGKAKLSLTASVLTVGEPGSNFKAEIQIRNEIYPLKILIDNDKINLSAHLSLPELDLWWPHTHGEPITHSYNIQLFHNSKCIQLSSGIIAFKKTEFVCNDIETAFYINGEKVFCRGVCWSLSDYLSLNTTRKELETLLILIRDAGINMIRVGGTMVYESDDFYALCDQLGILVWQDFMFASMDYPFEDKDFLENVNKEVIYQLDRLSKYVSIAIYCGNTDVKAQAAMYGIDKKFWSNEFFDARLPALCNSIHPGIPYLESSPTGGALPFHLSSGVSHYWGVGAYMHPVSDDNKTRVKFASEGMGLSHIPEDSFIQKNFGKERLFPFSNEFEFRIPRDLGAGWDFDAIRDHYVEDIFGGDARSIRRQDVERYISLSRVATGEALAQVFRSWRSMQSQCNGGLIWFAKDFWPCAGFGLIDSSNQPKAALYQLKQVWQSLQIILTNEGLDGAEVTLINETPNRFTGSLEIELIKDNNVTITKSSQPITLNCRETTKVSIDELIGGFFDTGYAYKFGKAQFDILACRLISLEGALISESNLFPNQDLLPFVHEAKISATAVQINEDEFELNLISSHFLQYLKIDVKEAHPESNYFHLSPNREQKVKIRKIENSTKRFRGHIEALNLATPIKINLL